MPDLILERRLLLPQASMAWCVVMPCTIFMGRPNGPFSLYLGFLVRPSAVFPFLLFGDLFLIFVVVLVAL